MSDFKTFKHRVTGKYGSYPAHFEDYPDFILCEPESCEDCKTEEPDLEPSPTEEPETEFLLTEETEEGDPEW